MAIDSSIILVAAFILVAANVFLYYRWRDLKDQYDEKQNTKRVGSAKNIVSEVSTKRTYSKTASPNAATASERDERLLGEARASVDELKRIMDEDLVQLHQKMVSSSQRFATQSTAA